MKNMMLQVKKYANIACFLGVLVALCVACQNGQNAPDAPAEYGPIAGNLPKPEWTAVADYDMTASMTAVVTRNIPANSIAVGNPAKVIKMIQ